MQTCNVDFLKNTVALTLTFKSWGGTAKGDLSQITTSADKTRLGITKKLLMAQEFMDVKRFMSDTKKYVNLRTMPFLGMKKGIYLAKADTVPEIEEALPERVKALGDLVMALATVWDDKVNESREKLDGQFNPRDYPTREMLPGLFGIEWNWIAFTVPENIPLELREAQAKKLGEKFAQAEEEITAALRAGFSDLVGHMVDRLKVEPGGKPKVFRDTLVSNLVEFIDTFKSRNLTNDAQLEQVVARARQIVVDANPEAFRNDMGRAALAERLRKSDGTRESVATKFGEIKAAMDDMIVNQVGRKFDFAQED